jgi:hypothetical protein
LVRAEEESTEQRTQKIPVVDATDGFERHPRPVCEEGEIGSGKERITLRSAKVPARRPSSENVETLRLVQELDDQTKNRLITR